MHHWTDERTEHAKKLWAEGISASAIAARLGGVTRNGVIGKMHREFGAKDKDVRARLLSEGGTRGARKARANAKAAKAAREPKRANGLGLGIRKPTAIEIERAKREIEEIKRRLAAEPDVARVNCLLDLEEHHCRWPVGDGPISFCGDTKTPGSSYCAKHLVRSVDNRGLAKVYATKAGAGIDCNPFALEDLVKETVVA